MLLKRLDGFTLPFALADNTLYIDPDRPDDATPEQLADYEIVDAEGRSFMYADEAEGVEFVKRVNESEAIESLLKALPGLLEWSGRATPASEVNTALVRAQVAFDRVKAIRESGVELKRGYPLRTYGTI